MSFDYQKDTNPRWEKNDKGNLDTVFFNTLGV